MDRTLSDPTYKTGDEVDIERKVVDDMASRRSGHVPAPLRKKREGLYKQFITPSGDPAKYLHTRSRSLSDLDVTEDRTDTKAINQRYEEMEKLKDMLKDEEATWTSNLQSWKSRRRSVTEDARKRKELREDIEKHKEINQRRKSKTYKEIIDEKLRREQEVLNDFGDENLSSNRHSDKKNSTDDSMYRITLHKSPNYSNGNNNSLKSLPVIDKRTRARYDDDDDDVQVVVQPLKYTSKVTAVINHVRVPSSQSKSSDDEISSPRFSYKPGPTLQQPNPQSEYSPTRKASTLPRSNIIEAPITVRSTVSVHASAPQSIQPKYTTPQHSVPQKSNVPKVVMRNKNPGYKKERPKSAYSSRDAEKSDWSKSLPRNYHNYSAPRPFVAGASDFSKYRKTNFASKRNMFENMTVKTDDEIKAETQSVENFYQPEKPAQNKDVLKRIQPAIERNSQVVVNNTHHNNVERTSMPVRGNVSAIMASLKESQAPKLRSGPPPKLPLVDVPKQLETKHIEPEIRKLEAPNVTATATLSPRGLAIKQVSNKPIHTTNQPQNSDALFHDMKICINQRPRSEKGFGFTVRGGDNGKPVIVDTVSPGGAADICQLCVSDEIVAINDVPLADCQSQDDIVQLIVSSVITGNLSLDIRRYGKPKKVSPLRLTGTKVVMTPGGFVQVRSDKMNGSNSLPRTTHNNAYSHKMSPKDANNNEDLPPPPTHAELMASRKSATLPAKSSSSPYGSRNSPLSGLINAANDNQQQPPNTNYRTGSRPGSGRSAGTSHSSISEVYSNQDIYSEEEHLRQEILEAQRALQTESNYAEMERRRVEDENILKMELLEEQARLEEEERRREDERRAMLEEARIEDLRIEKELKKIQENKMHRKREHEMRSPNNGLMGLSQGGDMPHWLIEEAERQRMAENDGKYRSNPLGYPQDDYHQSSGNYNSSSSHIWNDPSAQATLL